jgi:hypothetical protein
MRSVRLALSLLLVPLAACTTHAFTPSARPLPLGPARIPTTGESDVQLDGNVSGEVFGPGIYSGNVRYRRGVDENLAVTGDAGFIRVDGNNGSSDENPWAGLGRVGMQLAKETDGDLDAAVFGGVGGGYAPAAGGWLSSDVGAMLAGTNRYVRPIFLVDAYASQPVGTRTFMVGEDTLRLPRTYGVQGLFGFELGPQKSAVLIGLALAQLWSAANDVQEADSATFIGLGGGVRFDSLQ